MSEFYRREKIEKITLKVGIRGMMEEDRRVRDNLGQKAVKTVYNVVNNNNNNNNVNNNNNNNNNNTVIMSENVVGKKYYNSEPIKRRAIDAGCQE